MGQIDVFVKYLRVVLVYRIFYKNKPQAARYKRFRTYVNSKALALSLNHYFYPSIFKFRIDSVSCSLLKRLT